MNIIPASMYHDVYLIAMSLIVLTQALQLNGMDAYSIVYQPRSQSNNLKAFVLSLALVLFFGFRNPYSSVFADTIGYANRYFAIAKGGVYSVWYTLSSESSEVIWNSILILCGLNKLGIYTWFTIVAAIYIFGTYYAVKRIFPNNVFLGCTFAFLNFGFYSGAVNGLRNADALAVFLVAMSYTIVRNKSIRNLVATCLLLIIAYLIHHSIILPAIALFASVYIVKKTNTAIWFWLLSIVISLTAGSTVSAFFENMGFDDRLTSYISSGANESSMAQMFSHIGFRWDFLIFSAVPIVWGWYVTNKLKWKDRAYEIILNTYILANSVWVMVIRAAFSNRFAMLSWFLYFLVISYPLLKFELYRNQGGRIALALIFLLLVAIII